MVLLRVAAGCLAAVAAMAQPFPETVTRLQAANPANAKIEIQAAALRFHEGELIPLKVQFWRPGDLPKDRMWTFGGYLLSPAPDCGELSKPCYPQSPRDADRTDVDLNLAMPRLKPGRYRLAALRTLQVLKHRTAASSTFGYAEPRQYVVSNVVEFEVVPATPAWIRQTVDGAVKALNTPLDPVGYSDYGVRRGGARRLRFLQQPAAWEASLDLLELEEHELLAGLNEAADAPAVCGLMRRRLENPRQYVSPLYLGTLGTVCAKPGPPEAAERFRDAAADSLAAHLDARTGEALEQAWSTLLDNVRLANADRPGYRPAWLPRVRRQVLESMGAANVNRRREYLTGDWDLLRGPDAIPALEAVLDATAGPGAYDVVEVWRVAVRRLQEIDPGRARARMIAELRGPRIRLDEATAAFLPPDSVPEFTSHLLEALGAPDGPGGGDRRQAMALLGRWGSPQALAGVRAVYESQPEHCQPELLAYFLRVDAAYAARILQQPVPAQCTLRYFAVTARLQMTPAFEKFVAGYLTSPNVEYKMRAAEALGRYGSPTAAAPLWDTLRYFHEYWKDRREQIADHPENEFLEVALRNAVARARGWLARESDLRAIAALCITGRCAMETELDLQQWRAPLRAEVWLYAGEDFRGSVAQYTDLHSAEELQAKLAQFPSGSRLQLRVIGPGREAVAERLRAFAARHGMVE